jgi:UDP-N-acetylmuramoyl-tripeptide--D-alanyl-D-alanine ligase
MISTSFFYLLILFWAIHALDRTLFCLYFWQIKEYRFDRVRGDAKISLKVFFPKLFFVMLFIASLFLISPDPQNPQLLENFITGIFYFLGVYSIFRFFKNKIKFPKFTKKSIALLVVFSVLLVCVALIFQNEFSLFIVLAEILIPFVTFFVVQIFQIPTIIIKKYIYKKAEERIKQFKELIVIGINGSYGKSSSKEFLYTILSKKYNVLKTAGNINTEIGVAQTIIKDLKKEHQIFIVEMGAYRKGEIKLMCKMTMPKIGVVTGVNEQHLSLFGSMENLLLAEGGRELSDAIGENGTLIVNGDNKFCLKLIKDNKLPKKQEKIYALSNKIIDADIWADEITVHKDSISFLAITKEGDMMNFDAKVLGKHNVQNLLGAILLAKELGMGFGEISEACKDIKQDQSGMVHKIGKHGLDVIDSSYSANPDGVCADLDYLSIFPQKNVVVMPCLIELGEKSSEIHEKIGGKIGQICDLAIITSKDKFEELKKGAIKAGMKEKNIIFSANPQDICSIITLFCKSGDAVLLEGRVPVGLVDLLTR